MSTSPEQDAQLDRLNDQGLSYSQAYEQLGLTPPSADTVSVTAMEASQARKTAHDYYSEQFRLTGNEPITPEQAATNEVGRAACRAALNDRKTQQ